MLEKQALSDQIIIRCLNTNYGIAVTNLTFLPIGADTNSLIYKAQTLGQSSYFIKLKLGHHHDIGVEIVELLHQAGVQQIISPIKTKHGKSIQPIDDFSLVVYPFIEGQDGFSQSLTDDQWILLGKALRRVHEIEVPESIQKRFRREEYSSKWRDVVRSIYPYIENNPITDEIGLKLQLFMKRNMLYIHRLVNRAEELVPNHKSFHG